MPRPSNKTRGLYTWYGFPAWLSSVPAWPWLKNARLLPYLTSGAGRLLAKCQSNKTSTRDNNPPATTMTLHSRRDFVCLQRNVRSGHWVRVRIVLGRNTLHVTSLQQDHGADGQDRTRFTSSASFNLNDFKLEVGQLTSSVPSYYCLYLKSGHSRVTFGFQTIELLEVRTESCYLIGLSSWALLVECDHAVDVLPEIRVRVEGAEVPLVSGKVRAVLSEWCNVSCVEETTGRPGTWQWRAGQITGSDGERWRVTRERSQSQHSANCNVLLQDHTLSSCLGWTSPESLLPGISVTDWALSTGPSLGQSGEQKYPQKLVISPLRGTWNQ